MTKQTEDLPMVKTQSGALELARPQPAVADMLRLVVDKGISSENVAAFKELVQMHREEIAINAAKEFASSFNALQAEMPVIEAKTPIQNRGRYAKFEDVMQQVGPLLTKHGFSVSFRQEQRDGKITQTCRVNHVGGHWQETPFTVRLGGKADSDTQADLKASKTAKRKALEEAFNIVITQDCLNTEEDASLESGPVTEAQADELARRVAETNSDRAAFLKFAGAKSFKEIPASRYDDIDSMLTRKEQAR